MLDRLLANKQTTDHSAPRPPGTTSGRGTPHVHWDVWRYPCHGAGGVTPHVHWDVRMSAAHSPQAQGRVDRLFKGRRRIAAITYTGLVYLWLDNPAPPS